MTPSAPCASVNISAMKIFVGTAGGTPHKSSALCQLLLPTLPTRAGLIMPHFHQNLMGIGKQCDQKFSVMFNKTSITVYIPDSAVLLKGWYETSGAKLWRFVLLPKDHQSTQTDAKPVPVALNAHDLPSIGSIVRCLHAAAGFPVKSI